MFVAQIISRELQRWPPNDKYSAPYFKVASSTTLVLPNTLVEF